MSHYPLYRRSDAHCDEEDEAPADEKNQPFREGWDCLTKNAPRDLLTKLRPRLVLSGHTHHGKLYFMSGDSSDLMLCVRL